MPSAHRVGGRDASLPSSHTTHRAVRQWAVTNQVLDSLAYILSGVIHPSDSSILVVSVVFSTQLFAVCQYDFLVFAHSQAFCLFTPSFTSALNFVDIFFHCFQ